LARDSRAAQALQTELLEFASVRETEARKQKDRAEEFRARLLRARIQLVLGERPAPLAPSRAVLKYLPGEALLAAELLADGPERARAAQSVLGDPQSTDPMRARIVNLLPDLMRAERLSLRWDSALSLSAAVQSSDAAPEGVRTALIRERLRTLAQAGRLAQAMEEARTSLSPQHDYGLLVQLQLAAGEPASARRVLGQALASGSAGVELELARLELAQGRPWLARELLQSVLAKDPGNREAWLGFSTSLLPPARPRGASAANTTVAPSVTQP
jgi:tetratricopeptide (TPR) repeat protein